MFRIDGKYTTATVMIDGVESECIAQIQAFLNHPAFTQPVAIMPDTHAGKGSVIGFTMPLGDNVVPYTIGVDVGCGVLAEVIGDIPIDLPMLDTMIRKYVPTGFNVHTKPIRNFRREFPWHDANVSYALFRMAYEEKFEKKLPRVEFSYEWFTEFCGKIGASVDNVECSIGTLGGGNHFIEIARSDDGDIWVVVHSGSRNFGLKIANYYQQIAVKAQMAPKDFHLKVDKIRERFSGPDIAREIAKLKEEYRMGLPRDLAFLSGESAHEYFHAMIFAQHYAQFNRKVIVDEILKSIPDYMGGARREWIESVHNYIDFDDMIIRKGAIRSYKDEQLIIPLNMRDGSLIGVGKSNPVWNCSAPHGAGRIMSRSVAKRTLNVDAFRKQMDDSGIYTTSVGKDTIDEAPAAYKDAKLIEEAIAPTVDVIGKIRPLYNLKAGGE